MRKMVQPDVSTLVSELEGFKLGEKGQSNKRQSPARVPTTNRHVFRRSEVVRPSGSLSIIKPSRRIIDANRTSRRYQPYDRALRKSPDCARLQLKKLCSRCRAAVIPSANNFAPYDVKRLVSLRGLLDQSDFDGILPLRPLPVQRNSVEHSHADRVGQTCATQARHHQPEDSDSLTVNELAGYLEDFLYLPKSMSVMAEGMYA